METGQKRRHRVWVDTGQPFSSFDRTPLRHDFNEHPLMQLGALAGLAGRLSESGQCRFMSPGSGVASPFTHNPASPDGRSIAEVFGRIDEPGSWVALYNVESDPAYREFLQEVVTCLKPLVEPEQPGIFGTAGFIFISAPPSATPFHIDRENNCWLQIRAHKTLSVWDSRDRDTVPAADVDAFIVTGGLENVRLRPGLEARAQHYRVTSGDGVYFPYASPHMTRTEPGDAPSGDAVTVSIGVVFFTEHTRRRAYVHTANLVLRRLGLRPLDAGASAWRDAIKAFFGRGFVRVYSLLRGYKPRAGMVRSKP